MSTPLSTPLQADPAAFRLGMRHLGAGVSLIATRVGEQPLGLIATAVSSLTAEPPCLLVCVNRSASSHDAFIASGAFAVNVLTEHHQELCNQFSQSARKAERFTTGDWQQLSTSSPVLADALVTFDCELAQVVPWETHSILIGRVVDVAVNEQAGAPMMYFNSGFHTLKGL